MYIINTPFVKEIDDKTCAILKPNMDRRPPTNYIVNEIFKVFNQIPEVKKRVLLKLRVADTQVNIIEQ